jgi:mono/diheme cytochrome c family protein
MMCLAVGVVLSVLAWKGMPALEPQADPTASDYIPRPEWYFAGLFQFVKLFPGKFEVIGALVIPGIAMTAMMLLPWLDGGKTRAIGHRRGVIAAFSAGMAAVATLTIVGALDQPVRAGAGWNPREIAGMTLMATDRCARCHKPDGLAAPVEAGRISRPQDWVAAHIGDPDMIAAGLRDPPSANPRETQAILAALARLRAGAPPVVTDADRDADLIVTRHCLSCHTIDGVGSKTNDNLTQIGRKHDATWLQQWIADPKAIKADTEMPAFKSKLSPAELAALANWLAAHK